MRNKQSGYIRFLNRSIETNLPLSMKKKNPPSQLEKKSKLVSYFDDLSQED